VTTTDAAAARRQLHLVALALGMSLAGFGLAGCGGSLFDSASNTTQEPTPAPTAVAQQAPIAKVVINSVVGPPDPLGRQLHQEFASALGAQRVAVAGKNESADYHLRPYILAAKEKGGTKLSYVMDVTDTKTNQRVNRITGEEVVPSDSSKDSWASITPSVAQTIAAKATGSFVSWLPSAQPAVALNAPAHKASPPAGVGGEKDDAAAPQPKGMKQNSKLAAGGPPAAPMTGSITKDGSVTALIPTVTGAPGDGSAALTAAIQRELQAKGIAVAARPGASAYRVEGAVTLGEPSEGKQAIQIEWIVKDPQGKKLGTVSQKNDIPEGSLDGPWGRTADQAAGAAAQGILKLLPQASTAVN
jgi:hypothetical protein